MPKILVIQHAPHEGPGSFEEEIQRHNFARDTLMASDDAVFPSSVKIESYGGLLIMGGPMGVYEEKSCRWIRKELLVIEEALRQKKPILGVCLGAQMLARAAGGRVYPGGKKEIGWFPIHLDNWFSKRNPLFFQIDASMPQTVFHWHGDTFDIPTEGYRLAWNENYKNQAFAFQGNAVGLQFHVEMTEGMIRTWLSDPDLRAQAQAAGFDPDRVIQESSRHLAGLRELSHKVFYGFASLVRENVERPATAASR